jgi:hypothetical protein
LRLCTLAAARPIHERPFATHAEWVAVVGDNMEQRQRRTQAEAEAEAEAEACRRQLSFHLLFGAPLPRVHSRQAGGQAGRQSVSQADTS